MRKYNHLRVQLCVIGTQSDGQMPWSEEVTFQLKVIFSAYDF